jgi:hypothetical protein
MYLRDALVTLRLQDVSKIGESFLREVRVEPRLLQLSSLCDRAIFNLHQDHGTFLIFCQTDRAVVRALPRPCPLYLNSVAQHRHPRVGARFIRSVHVSALVCTVLTRLALAGVARPLLDVNTAF